MEGTLNAEQSNIEYTDDWCCRKMFGLVRIGPVHE
jgi:hypothetical protein